MFRTRRSLVMIAVATVASSVGLLACDPNAPATPTDTPDSTVQDPENVGTAIAGVTLTVGDIETAFEYRMTIDRRTSSLDQVELDETIDRRNHLAKAEATVKLPLPSELLVLGAFRSTRRISGFACLAKGRVLLNNEVVHEYAIKFSNTHESIIFHESLDLVPHLGENPDSALVTGEVDIYQFPASMFEELTEDTPTDQALDQVTKYSSPLRIDFLAETAN